ERDARGGETLEEIVRWHGENDTTAPGQTHGRFPGTLDSGPPGPDTVAAVLPLYDDNPVSRRAVVPLLFFAACVVAFFFWQPSPFEDTTDDIRFDLRYAAIPCEVLENRPLTRPAGGAPFNLGPTD